jgi:DNA replication protein DnaC
LLTIDDFTLREFAQTRAEELAEELYELIDRRYRQNSRVVTTNRSPRDWYPLLPNPVIAESAPRDIAAQLSIGLAQSSTNW